MLANVIPFDDLDQRTGENFGRAVFLLQQASCPHFDKRESVMPLMIIRRGRIWNENRRDAHGRKLSQRRSARAADSGGGSAQRYMHFIEEGLNERGKRESAVGLDQVLCVRS